ncbi:MAG TPA: cysteine desulfurase family protein [Kofleriaceae bacterium]|nr:cysteine desulfurase family protein [Kofleriaceae bacterium]
MDRARVYLDHNATSPLCPPAKAAMTAALEVFGNPSSIHREGRAARDIIETARRDIAALVGADPADIVLTSGGTEADGLAIFGLWAAAPDRPPRIATAGIEHPAVIGAAHTAVAGRGDGEVAWLATDGDGVIDGDSLAASLRLGCRLVAVGLANHELGTLQDVAAMARATRAAGAHLHVDAVQAAGKIPVDVTALGADTVAISAHKIGGPKGAGALWIRPGLDIAPTHAAGHQERERRPGTENVVGIAGFGAAARVARETCRQDMAALASLLEDGLGEIPGTRIHGRGAPRVGNTVNAGFSGVLGETLCQALDLAGFAVSTGAACTSGSVKPSAVLLAIGLSADEAKSAVRFSLGPTTTEAEIRALVAALPALVARARAV